MRIYLVESKLVHILRITWYNLIGPIFCIGVRDCYSGIQLTLSDKYHETVWYIFPTVDKSSIDIFIIFLNEIHFLFRFLSYVGELWTYLYCYHKNGNNVNHDQFLKLKKLSWSKSGIIFITHFGSSGSKPYGSLYWRD